MLCKKVCRMFYCIDWKPSVSCFDSDFEPFLLTTQKNLETKQYCCMLVSNRIINLFSRKKHDVTSLEFYQTLWIFQFPCFLCLIYEEINNVSLDVSHFCSISRKKQKHDFFLKKKNIGIKSVFWTKVVLTRCCWIRSLVFGCFWFWHLQVWCGNWYPFVNFTFSIQLWPELPFSSQQLSIRWL